MLFVIARRELRSLFLSPLAWVILAVIQLIMSFLFLLLLEQYLQAQPRLHLVENAPGATEFIVGTLFHSTTFILLFGIPLITMRVISEERRNRTLPLLFSAPVSMSEIVLGKYLGIVGFLAGMLLMITLMPLSLLFSSPIDLGLLASLLLGTLLLVASFAAAGFFMSTLTTQPIIAAIASYGLLLFLWLINLAGSGVEQQGSKTLLNYLSLVSHFEPMTKGIVNSGDVSFYLLFIGTFLILSIRRLDNDRLQH